MEYVADRDVPPIIYVPLEGVDTGRGQIGLRRMKNGQLVVIAYSALDRLKHALGSQQGWMLVHTSDLEQQAVRQNISRIILDPIPEREGWGR